MLQTADIVFGGRLLIVAADRTLFDPHTKTLYIADLHAGKTNHFQRAGIAIPAGNLESDLQRLSSALLRTHAKNLLFLGDLFHSEVNAEWQLFADWCGRQNVAMTLIRGNHDRFLSDEQLIDAGIRPVLEPYQKGEFTLRHHPDPGGNPDTPVIAGHVHPVHRIYAIGNDRLRLPCFFLSGYQLILPAFGSFTGGYDITDQSADKRVCCASDFESLLVLNQ